MLPHDDELPPSSNHELAIYRELVKQIPEWLTFGVWDTPRCPACQGFQFDSAYHKPKGHKDNCPLKAAKEIERERASRLALPAQQDARG